MSFHAVSTPFKDSVPVYSTICVHIASGKSCSENDIAQGPSIAASAESVLRILDKDKPVDETFCACCLLAVAVLNLRL